MYHSATSSAKKGINLEIVRTGGCIVFCDYLSENITNGDQLSWMLTNHLNLMLTLSEEAPVFEFLASLHRNEESSALFLNVILTKDISHVDVSISKKIKSFCFIFFFLSAIVKNKNFK